jgi:hypothetical protein
MDSSLRSWCILNSIEEWICCEQLNVASSMKTLQHANGYIRDGQMMELAKAFGEG